MRDRCGPLLARQLDPEYRQQYAEHDHRGGCRKDHLRMPRLAQRVRSGAKPEDRETPDSGRDHDDHRRKHRDAVGRKLERPRHGEHQPADEEARQRRGSRAHDADFSRGYPPSVPEPSYSSGDDYVVEFLGFRFSFNAFDFEQRVTAAAVKLGLVEGNDLDEEETADLVELTAAGRSAAPTSGSGLDPVRHWEPPHPVLAKSVDADPPGARLLQDPALVVRGREDGHDVQPRGNAPNLSHRQLSRERANKRVPPAAITPPHPAEMPVELAAAEEIGER